MDSADWGGRFDWDADGRFVLYPFRPIEVDGVVDDNGTVAFTFFVSVTADGTLVFGPGEGEQPTDDVLRRYVLKQFEPIVGGGLRFPHGTVVRDGRGQSVPPLDEEGVFDLEELDD